MATIRGSSPKQLQNLPVGLQAQGPDQAGDGELAVLVDADPEHLAGVGFILQPGAPVGDDSAGQQGQIGLGVDLLAVVDAGERTIWLTTTRSAPLMTKVPACGHQGEVPHEDLLLLDLLGLLVAQAHAAPSWGAA